MQNGPAVARKQRRTERPLRVLGTEITLLEPLRVRAAADLGLEIEFEVLDFVDAQRKAATQPDAFDVYDQCFHNLDIVWNWHALQPIDTRRIAAWDQVSPLTKQGRLSATASLGRGDVPASRLYVQADQSLGSGPTRYISMLPTVYDMDSFIFEPALFADRGAARASWSWLVDDAARGRVALVDEPAIGALDAALALECAGEMHFGDIGNMSLREIDGLMSILSARQKLGHFCGLWKTPADSVRLFLSGRARLQTVWSPAITVLRSAGCPAEEAVPAEGYRAWHGGLALSSRLRGPLLDAAYDYLNWWLSGWPGALMARQGYYMSAVDAVRQHLATPEWDYWYGGERAARDLPGPDGQLAIRRGQCRPGGSYVARASKIALWDTTMDEHNYLVRRWSDFAALMPT
jgi:putative spermidine/putrescine transport system substrate-binding protein